MLMASQTLELDEAFVGIVSILYGALADDGVCEIVSLMIFLAADGVFGIVSVTIFFGGFCFFAAKKVLRSVSCKGDNGVGMLKCIDLRMMVFRPTAAISR